jgi:hypothetical protein
MIQKTLAKDESSTVRKDLKARSEDCRSDSDNSVRGQSKRDHRIAKNPKRDREGKTKRHQKRRKISFSDSSKSGSSSLSN